METRTKRRAAIKPPIIDISDSEDNELLPPTPKKKKINEKTRQTKTRTKQPKIVKTKTKIQSNLEEVEEIIHEEKDIKFKPIEIKIQKDSKPLKVNIKKDFTSVEKHEIVEKNSFKKLAHVWEDYELLGELENIDLNSSKNIITLFEDDNTIPFICRYRRDMIREDITPEKLRNIKNTYIEILDLKKRASSIINKLQKDGILTNAIQNELLCARTINELEHFYSPYKPANKGTLADRAKALGLEEHAKHILAGESPALRIETLLDHTNPELDTNEKISNGICNIISHIISKTTEVLEEIRRLQKHKPILLKCQKIKETKEQKENKTSDSKYELYFNFTNSTSSIKPHQILAINRGEKAKELSVTIILQSGFRNELKYFVKKHFLTKGCQYTLRQIIMEKSFEECFSKKLLPLIRRQIRSDLNEKAAKASIDVFAKNLKQLLLMSPLKGERILGIDPGFSNGCKLALITETTDVIETDVIYPHGKFGNLKESEKKLVDILKRNKCNLIALGNGTACRETEFWITKLFDNGILNKESIRYCIVSEQGASIYSCGDVAKKEFPKMDVNLISAVSIARRLNDPLCEYVKIEPRHIGVGMYQHDINDKILTQTLNEVVMECVSFVGVDINTASVSLLKHISGLTSSRAEKIIEYRIKNGSFKTRKDLLKVKTIGEKTFTQCAGFIRIEPLSVEGKSINLLDCTWVHPESYHIAEKIISECKLNINQIGELNFIETIKNYSRSMSLDDLGMKFKIPKERIKIILEGLQREPFRDYRIEFNKKPLFKQGITKMSDLKIGIQLTGVVTNITHFGAFVDVGIERDGLIHVSKMNGLHLNIGDRVETKISDLDLRRNRLQLKLQDII